MLAALPRPNQRMKSGTHASDGIGLSTVTSGSTNDSTRRKRPMSMPIGTPMTSASARPTTIRNIVYAMCTKRVPFSAMRPIAAPIASTDGVMAGGSMPLRANTSHAAAARPNESTMPSGLIA